MAVVLINPFMGVIKTRQGESKLRRVPPCCLQHGDATNLDAGEGILCCKSDISPEASLAYR